METCVEFETISCGVYGEQSGTGAGFSVSTLVFLSLPQFSTLVYSSLPIIDIFWQLKVSLNNTLQEKKNTQHYETNGLKFQTISFIALCRVS